MLNLPRTALQGLAIACVLYHILNVLQLCCRYVWRSMHELPCRFRTATDPAAAATNTAAPNTVGPTAAGTKVQLQPSAVPAGCSRHQGLRYCS